MLFIISSISLTWIITYFDSWLEWVLSYHHGMVLPPLGFKLGIPGSWGKITNHFAVKAHKWVLKCSTLYNITNSIVLIYLQKLLHALRNPALMVESVRIGPSHMNVNVHQDIQAKTARLVRTKTQRCIHQIDTSLLSNISDTLHHCN